MTAEKEFAVHVIGVSKIYNLCWWTPQEKIVSFLKRAWQLITDLNFWENNVNAKHRLSLWHRTKFINLRLRKPVPTKQEFYALKEVSFAILKGESWGIIGINGSGKSTLLKIISGNLRPSTGRIEVDGKVAILDYGSGFNGNFTGKENIFIKAGLLGLTKKQICERYEAIVEFADIGDFINQPVNTYSSGMSARLGFAIMAHVEADIIITDEALAVGDVFFVQKCMRFIRSFLEKGTFLFVSHSMNDVVSLCNKAIWLEKGKIRAIGLAAEVTSAYLNEEALNTAQRHPIEEIKEPVDKKKEARKIVQTKIGIEQPRLSELRQSCAPPPVGKGSSRNYCAHYSQIEVSAFSKNQRGVDLGGAKILKVAFYDGRGVLLRSLRGGDLLQLTIELLAQWDLHSPIIGYQVMNSAGQVIFADNSHELTQEQGVVINRGTLFAVEFRLPMPYLPLGIYNLRAAIAQGEKEGREAVLLQTIDGALRLDCVSSSVQEGLIGLAMHSVKITTKEVMQENRLVAYNSAC